MNNLKLRLCGDLVLRETCLPVPEITPELKKILDEMISIMDKNKGVGLAAPQVGVLERFLVMTDPDSKQIYKMINPELVSKSAELSQMEEGCLSVLGNDNIPVYSDVIRPRSVVVQWTNENGEKKCAEMFGIAARIIQHEIDHLDGVLFIDYLSRIKREQVMRRVKKYKAGA